LIVGIGGINPFKDSNDLLIFAHRAGAQVVPENTIEGWKESKALYNPDVWELDVHLTADDSLIVIHDETVDRTTNGSGNVRDMTFDELRKLDAGFWFTPDSGLTFPWRNKGVKIPTMAEVFDSFPDDRFNIEIKDSLTWEADILVSGATINTVLLDAALANNEASDGDVVWLVGGYTDTVNAFRLFKTEITAIAAAYPVEAIIDTDVDSIVAYSDRALLADEIIPQDECPGMTGQVKKLQVRVQSYVPLSFFGAELDYIADK
jgi:hypothetical protein